MPIMMQVSKDREAILLTLLSSHFVLQFQYTVPYPKVPTPKPLLFQSVNQFIALTVLHICTSLLLIEFPDFCPACHCQIGYTIHCAANQPYVWNAPENSKPQTSQTLKFQTVNQTNPSFIFQNRTLNHQTSKKLNRTPNLSIIAHR